MNGLARRVVIPIRYLRNFFASAAIKEIATGLRAGRVLLRFFDWLFSCVIAKRYMRL